MNRKEAAEVLTALKQSLEMSDDYDYCYYSRDIDAYDTALAAMRGPQPDHITGLVPCGCGGVTEQTDFHDGFFPYSRVECLECGIQMMRAGDTFLEAHAEVKRDWNTAMGRKGCAE